MSLPYAVELGLRGMRRHPRTVLLAVLTLALGLASVMTMLTLQAMLSADPLPGLSQQLYLGWVDSRQIARQDDPDAGEPPQALWKLDDATAFMATLPQVRQAALTLSTFDVSDQARTRHQQAYAISALGPMPALFGLPLRSGRYWTDAEERNRAPVAIISHALSLKLLGSENGVGRQIRLGKQLFQVVGISDDWRPRPAFYFLNGPEAAWQQYPLEVFVPARAALDADAKPGFVQDCDDTGHAGVRFNELDLGACRWLMLWAQLSTPVQVNAYRDALSAFAQARHADGVFQRAPQVALYGVAEWLARNRVVPDSVRLNVWLALALLGLCIVNVAGLLAARFLRRSAEFGVHRVLGAPRAAVFVRCLTEAGAIGLLGGVLALPATLFGLWIVRMQAETYSDLARFQPSLFLAMVALAIGTGLLVGLLPAWRAALLQPALQVKSL
ncbi:MULTISPECIES: ABC transporter permease [Xanthomonas]|nr:MULTISPECIES: ABC transporter permease [Xanthomonas]MDQ7760874.1 ABC transporter permease [Xanthomonas sontii]UYK84354.1 ABC transporter permease [Xanthomonas sacchari]